MIMKLLTDFTPIFYFYTSPTHRKTSRADKTLPLHCVISVRNWRFSGPYNFLLRITPLFNLKRENNYQKNSE